MSGLAAARALADANDVTVFEAAPRLGGHSSTVLVDGPEGQQPVDIGFIVFNDRNYPNFTELLGSLGVVPVRSNMSFSVASEDGAFEYAGSSPNALLATRSNIFRPAFHRMVRDLLRFNSDARRLIAEGSAADGVSLRSFLEQGGYGEWFIERLLVPQVSAVWSAAPETMDAFPARIVFEFFNNHGILEVRGRPRWYTLEGGSATYVDRLCSTTPARFETATAVEHVRRHDGGVSLGLADGVEEDFDHVVIAAHSDQALRMLADPTEAERSILGAIPYQQNEVVLHTDDSLMPKRRAAWASWNYHLRRAPQSRTTVTYWMNSLQPLHGSTNYFVTLNQTERIDPSRVIQIQRFDHPVFSAAGLEAQRRHHEISGVSATHFCGAYWRWGFHEDGVWSGLRAARGIGLLGSAGDQDPDADLALA